MMITQSDRAHTAHTRHTAQLHARKVSMTTVMSHDDCENDVNTLARLAYQIDKIVVQTGGWES